MASIHSESENNLVRSLILSTKGAWIGGKRVCTGCDQWAWSDRTPWDFVNWRTGEPDNKLGKENIMGMKIDGGWFDDGAEVGETRPFLCSKRSSPPSSGSSQLKSLYILYAYRVSPKKGYLEA